MNDDDVYRVTIRHNLVIAVEPIRIAKPLPPGLTNLEIGRQLTRNHMENGCIDGEYLFKSMHDARDFAVLSLEFARLLFEKAHDHLKSYNFYVAPTWRNPVWPPHGTPPPGD